MSQLFASGGQNIGFSLNISPSNEHPGLISFRMDWLDLLAVQGTLKILLQHHSSEACSARIKSHTSRASGLLKEKVLPFCTAPPSELPVSLNGV